MYLVQILPELCSTLALLAGRAADGSLADGAEHSRVLLVNERRWGDVDTAFRTEVRASPRGRCRGLQCHAGCARVSLRTSALACRTEDRTSSTGRPPPLPPHTQAERWFEVEELGAPAAVHAVRAMSGDTGVLGTPWRGPCPLACVVLP